MNMRNECLPEPLGGQAAWVKSGQCRERCMQKMSSRKNRKTDIVTLSIPNSKVFRERKTMQ